MPWAIQVIEISGDRVSGSTRSSRPDRLFPAFGLPIPPVVLDRQIEQLIQLAATSSRYMWPPARTGR